MSLVPSLLDLRCIVAEPLKDNSGYTLTLATWLGEMLNAVEEKYGERDKSYTILGVEFSESGPQLWYPRDCKNIVIQLHSSCLSDIPTACYELSHEVVHLLSPTGAEAATHLEEGMAALFSKEYMARNFAGEWLPQITEYQDSACAVEQLLDNCPTLIKDLRRDEPTISKISREALQAACPETESGLIDYLCSPFTRE